MFSIICSILEASRSLKNEKRENTHMADETLWNTGEKRGPTLFFLNKFFLAKNLALANSEIHH